MFILAYYIHNVNTMRMRMLHYFKFNRLKILEESFKILISMNHTNREWYSLIVVNKVQIYEKHVKSLIFADKINLIKGVNFFKNSV